MVSFGLARLRGAAWLAMAGAAGGTALAFWSDHASAAEVAQAPAPLRAALEAAWARHPLSAATDATLDAAQARSDAAAQPLMTTEIEFTDAAETAELRVAVVVPVVAVPV